MLGGPTMNLLHRRRPVRASLLVGIGTPQPTHHGRPRSSSASSRDRRGRRAPAAERRPDRPRAAGRPGCSPATRSSRSTARRSPSWDDSDRRSSAPPGEPTVARPCDRDGSRSTCTVDARSTTSARRRRARRDHDRVDAAGFLGVAPTGRTYRSAQPSTAVPADHVASIAVGTVRRSCTLPAKIAGLVADAVFGGRQRDPNGPVSVVGVGRLGGEIAATRRARDRRTRSCCLLSLLAGAQPVRCSCSTCCRCCRWTAATSPARCTRRPSARSAPAARPARPRPGRRRQAAAASPTSWRRVHAGAWPCC